MTTQTHMRGQVCEVVQPDPPVFALGHGCSWSFLSPQVIYSWEKWSGNGWTGAERWSGVSHGNPGVRWWRSTNPEGGQWKEKERDRNADLTIQRKLPKARQLTGYVGRWEREERIKKWVESFVSAWLETWWKVKAGGGMVWVGKLLCVLGAEGPIRRCKGWVVRDG